MGFPEKLTNGFNFDEAITMAELCRRVYRVFEFEKGRDIQELYDTIYNDEWIFVHCTCDDKTDDRALILRRKDMNQYAVVFRGTILTEGGFDMTGMSYNEEIQLVEYKVIPREQTPPSDNTRVFQGMQKGFEVVRDEIELFFDILRGCKIDQRQIFSLLDCSQEELDSRISAMVAALCIQDPPCLDPQKRHKEINSFIKLYKINVISKINFFYNFNKGVKEGVTIKLVDYTVG